MLDSWPEFEAGKRNQHMFTNTTLSALRIVLGNTSRVQNGRPLMFYTSALALK